VDLIVEGLNTERGRLQVEEQLMND